MKTVGILLVVLVVASCVSSRWLPTRDNTDRLDKLREMLRDILESEYEKSMYNGNSNNNRGSLFKREVGPSMDAPSIGAGDGDRSASGVRKN